jgi:hypothetical protein
MKKIGDTKTLAFEVGGIVDDNDELRILTIWIAGQLVNTKDNIAFVPSVISAAKDELSSNKQRNLTRYSAYFKDFSVKQIHQYIVRSRVSAEPGYPEDYELFGNHQVLDWGVNTDEVFSFLIQIGDKKYITVQSLSDIGKENSESDILFSEIETAYFEEVLEKLINELKE